MLLPTVSVVIPTRNRRNPLMRLLRTLAADVTSSPFEVIVADDGSTDDTVESITSAEWPFPLRVIGQQGSGAAAARNAGAHVACGDILLFLDDDVEPRPGLVAAHGAAHFDAEDVVALGDLPPAIAGETFFGVILRGWWEAMQSGVRRPGHRYGYRDLLSGHFSIRRAQFDRLGGFDATLRCREDYELGYRAITTGLQLRFVPHAVVWHHDTTDLARAFQRKLDEGVADVHLLRVHPRLGSSLPLAWKPSRSRIQHLLIRCAWSSPVPGDVAARMLTSLLPVLEWLRLRGRWRGLLEALLAYRYWHGVAVTAGSRVALDALLAASSSTGGSLVVIDLARGLDAAAQQVDALRPSAMRLVLGDEAVGDVPDAPGWEPLRGAHLPTLLATWFPHAYLRALTAAGLVPPALIASVAAAAPADDAAAQQDVVAA